MTGLSLSLLGPTQTILDGEPLTEFRTKKVQALLYYLATEPGAHSRGTLLELLWPGLPERSARSNLRQILYYARQALPVVENGRGEAVKLELLIANRQNIQLNPAAGVEVDCLKFESLLDQSQGHDHLDILYCRECRGRLEAAVELYQGDFLVDFYLDDSNDYEEWAAARRAYFRRKALDALATLTTIATRGKDYALAQGFAERQLVQHTGNI